MNAERKYKDPFDFQPMCLIILTSNVVWNPKDLSTGLQRRIIYIRMFTMPKVKDENIFHLDFSTGVASGTLAKDLPGLVNWLLANPEENNEYLKDAAKTNNLICPEAMSNTNPLVEWIESYLTFKPKDNLYTRVGSKSSDPNTYLYPNYLRFCREYGYKPLPFNNFSNLLVQQLNVLHDSSIHKRKIEVGTVITDISLNSDPVYITSKSTPQKSKLDIMEEFNGFTNYHPSHGIIINTFPR